MQRLVESMIPQSGMQLAGAAMSGAGKPKGREKTMLAYKYEAENKHIPYCSKTKAYEEQRDLFSTEEGSEEEEEFRKHLHRILGLVFRAVSMNSREAREEPGIAKAIEEEMYKVTKKLGALVIEEVEEWSRVKARNPRAQRARSHFVVGEKGVEFVSGHPSRFYKARLVIDGHDIRNSWRCGSAESRHTG